MITLTFGFRHMNVMKVSACALTGWQKQMTWPVTDESNFSHCCHIVVHALSMQSCDSPPVHDWPPRLIGIASVEDTLVWSIAADCHT